MSDVDEAAAVAAAGEKARRVHWRLVVTAVLSPDPDLEHRWALDEARRLLGLHRRRPPSISLPEVIRAGPSPRAILSYGLDVDTSAVAAKLLTDPSSRDFALDGLAVITGIISSSVQV